MKTDLGYIRGAQGEVGPQGETGAQGPAATIEVGSVTTSAYGTPAKVVNSGTKNAARFDFTIPQGAPGETVADVSELTANFITESTESYPTYTVTEKMKVILGKIKKYLADLKSEAASLASKIIAAEKNITNIQTDVGEINTALTDKLDKTDVIANLTATTSGKALDATQGKALQDQITQLNSDSGIVNYKDKITSDIIENYNNNYQQASIVTMPSGSKFAIFDLAFNVKSNYKANMQIEIMNLPVELVPKRNVVLSAFNNKRATFAYISVSSNKMVFDTSVDITSAMELNIIGTYQIS